MKIKNLKIFSIIFLIVILYGCAAPKKIVKTPEICFQDKILPVSEEEYNYYNNLIKTGKSSNERAEGAFWSGQYHYTRNDLKSAIKYFEYNEKYYRDVIWGFLSLLRLVDIYIDSKANDKALEKILVLIEIRHIFSQYENEIYKKLEDLLKISTENEIFSIYEKHLHKIIDEYAIYYLSNLSYEKKDYENFFKYANIFLQEFSQSKFFDEISKKFKEAIKFKPVNNKKLGAILPLSGKEVELGEQIKKGLELALGEYNENKPAEEQIQIIFIDESEEENKLISDITKTIEQENVIALIGPLYSNTAKKILPIIDRYNIVLFSPTASQPDLIGKSQYFFRNCGTAKGQAYAIAKYIIENTNIKNIGILYPDNAFGKTLKSYFSEKFINLGGKVLKEVSFQPEKTDFRDEMILLGGVNTNLIKEQRSKEKIDLNDKMKDAANKNIDEIESYFNLPKKETEKANIEKAKKELTKKIKIALLHLSPVGDNIIKYNLDTDATRQLSFTLAKDYRIDVLKQKVTDDAMEAIGVEPEDIDREIAINIARDVGADVLIWGEIIEEKTNTIFANFIPQIKVDEKGNTQIVYEFTDDDYFFYTIKLYALSVADETLICEQKINYKKIKEADPNSLNIEGLYIPATDKKMILIKDQLKFYSLDLPVFGASTLASNYILSFLESVTGIIFPQEFYSGSEDPDLQNFTEKFKEKFAVQPNMISANSYDLMKICIQAIDSKILSREEFKNYLKNLKTYKSLSGPFNFNFEGDSVIDYYIMKIETDGIKFIKKIRGE